VTPPETAPAGRIHDLGYQRYVGARRSQATRWRVITRQLLAFAWKRWTRYRLWLGSTTVLLAVLAGVLVWVRTKGLEVAGAEDTAAGEIVVSAVDQVVFGAFSWFTKPAFLLTLTVGCGVIASDLRSGAFSFYFVRPVRPGDYVLGKFVALALLHAGLVLAPLLVLTLVRVGVAETSAQLVEALGYLPRALLIGGLASLAYAAASLGVSAVSRSTGINLAVWCGYHLVFTLVVAGIALQVGVPALAVVDTGVAINALVADLFDAPMAGGGVELPSALAGGLALAAYVVAGLGLAYWRVRGAALQGIGGGS
jgi:ABC-type transport system involved in multi-copper enzyme maturation permease subunit